MKNLSLLIIGLSLAAVGISTSITSESTQQPRKQPPKGPNDRRKGFDEYAYCSFYSNVNTPPE